MAAKLYKVIKDGNEVGSVKGLAAAKTLADEKGGDVFSGDQCVYHGAAENSETTGAASDGAADTAAASDTVTETVNAEPVEEKKPAQTKTEEAVTEKFRLKALMNVRKKPSKESGILGTMPAGTVVDVSGIEDDWLHLRDDSYILYQNGKFAERL